MASAKALEIRAFFDEPTNTISYLIWDGETKRGAVIDPVLDYDQDAGEVDTRSVEAILRAAREAGVGIDWALETHAHADHLSGAPYIKAETRAFTHFFCGKKRRKDILFYIFRNTSSIVFNSYFYKPGIMC